MRRRSTDWPAVIAAERWAASIASQGRLVTRPARVRSIAGLLGREAARAGRDFVGKGADVPALRRASQRTGVAFSLDSDRHFDLCHWAMGHLRLPIRYMSIKAVARYLGLLDSDHGIGSGDEAVAIYLQAVRTPRKKAKADARARFEAYNAEDVDETIRLIEPLRMMSPQVPREHPQPPRRVKRNPAVAPKRRWKIEIAPAEPGDLGDPQAWMDDDELSIFE